jgi:hypothetical protein
MLDEGNLDSWSRGRARLHNLAKQMGKDPNDLYDEIIKILNHETFSSLHAFLGQPKYAWMATDNATALYKAWKAKLS